MGVGCGGFNLNRIMASKSLSDIGNLFKSNVVGTGRYHTNPTDLLSVGIDHSNPVGFLAAGGNRNGSLLQQLSAISGVNNGQQSYGRLFSKLPKGFTF